MSVELSILRTKNLSIGYSNRGKDLIVGQSIDLTLSRGQLIGLVGINGSGKSTLLRTLSGLQPPLSGSVILSEDMLGDIHPTELAKKISVVLTNQPISKNLSVLELVSLGRQPYTNWLGTLTENDHTAVINAMLATDTESLKNKKCHELSDGQLQRVLIARAVAQETEIILLDEPMTHLDLHHKAAILNLLFDIAHENEKTILFSTHDIDYALNRCDSMIILKDGKSIHKTPAELIEEKVFETLFPSKNVSFDSERRIFLLK